MPKVAVMVSSVRCKSVIVTPDRSAKARAADSTVARVRSSASGEAY